MKTKIFKICILIVLLCLAPAFSGCALLQIPAKIIDGTFGLIGQLLKLVGSMPKPPPWIF